MQYGEKFKKSLFGGFKKKDVLKCFEELDNLHQTELSMAYDKCEEVKNELTITKLSLETMTKALADKNKIVDEQSKKIITLEEEKKTLSETVEALSREILEHKALNSKLSMSQKVLENNLKELEKNSTKDAFEQAKYEIGEIMMEAKTTADKIVSRAEEKSDRLSQTVEFETAKTGVRFDKAREKIENAIESFKSLSTDVVSGMQDLSRNLKSARANITGEEAPEKKELGAELKKIFKSDFLFRK